MRADILRPAEPNRFINALLYECKFTCIIYHDNPRITKIKLLLARSIPVQLRRLVQLNIPKQKLILAPAHHLLVHECFEFVDVIADWWFEWDCFVVGKSFKEDLRLCDLVDFKFVFVTQFTHADVVCIHRTTQTSDGYLRSICLPASRCDWLLVLDWFYTGFFVHSFAHWLLEQIEFIEIKKNYTVTWWWLLAPWEFFHTCILGLVCFVD